MEKFHLWCFLMAASLVLGSIPVGGVGALTGNITPFLPIALVMVMLGVLSLGLVMITSIISEIRKK